ncbi:MAG: DNA phosphorothioation-associated putative methyltransferase [Cyanobacteriota bacterium]|nr:DNA phosphorothioation-associated putative methyltransferase [Cyanobacteriota bacterium]
MKGELLSESEIIEELGSLHRAFQVVLQVTDQHEWHQIAEQPKQDLMLYLALTNFGYCSRLNQLTSEVQEDLKALLGTYRQACTQADEMLKSLGNLNFVAEKCRSSSIGRCECKSLTVHVTALENLDPLLRLYESCATRTIGRPEGAMLVKFHSRQPKIAYHFYPTFETDLHPTLHTYMEIDLRDLHVKYHDFDAEDNAPILHRKETCLDDHCATLQGHRVVWRKDADPYKVKLLRSQIRSRQKQ